MEPENEEESAIETIIMLVLGFAVLYIIGVTIEYVIENIRLFIFLGLCIAGAAAYYLINKSNREYESARVERLEDQERRNQQHEENRAIDEAKKPLDILKSETDKNQQKINFLEEKIRDNEQLISALQEKISNLKIGKKGDYLAQADALIRVIDQELNLMR